MWWYIQHLPYHGPKILQGCNSLASPWCGLPIIPETTTKDSRIGMFSYAFRTFLVMVSCPDHWARGEGGIARTVARCVRCIQVIIFCSPLAPSPVNLMSGMSLVRSRHIVDVTLVTFVYIAQQPFVSYLSLWLTTFVCAYSYFVDLYRYRPKKKSKSFSITMGKM